MIEDFSEHQIERLKCAFRRRLKDEILEAVEVTHYLQRAAPHQMAAPVPDERMGKEETRLKHSAFHDLTTLMQLQQRFSATRAALFLEE